MDYVQQLDPQPTKIITNNNIICRHRYNIIDILIIIIITIYVGAGTTILIKYKYDNYCQISHMWFYVLISILITGCTKILCISMIKSKDIVYTIICYILIDFTMGTWGVYERYGVPYMLTNNLTYDNITNINSTDCMKLINSNTGKFTNIALVMHLFLAFALSIFVISKCFKC